MAAFVINMSHIKETWGFAKACLQLRALSRDRKIEKNMVKSRGARNCQKSGAWNLLDNWQRPYVSQKRQRHDQICLRSSAGDGGIFGIIGWLETAPACPCWWWLLLGHFFHLWTLNLIVAVWNTAIDCCMKFENIITFILTIICSQYLCNWGSEEERVEHWTGVVDNCAIYFTDSSLASKVITVGGVSQWKKVISLRECVHVLWLCNFSQHFIKNGWCLFSFSSVDQKEAVN